LPFFSSDSSGLIERNQHPLATAKSHIGMNCMAIPSCIVVPCSLVVNLGWRDCSPEDASFVWPCMLVNPSRTYFHIHFSKRLRLYPAAIPTVIGRRMETAQFHVTQHV
jgi:hypothetical protein